MIIQWTEPAIQDLESIKNYISKDSEHYAIIFLEKIFLSLENLISFPEIGRRVPEAEKENIREIIYSNYRIIYKLEENRILILAIIHGSRNLLQMEPKPWEII